MAIAGFLAAWALGFVAVRTPMPVTRELPAKLAVAFLAFVSVVFASWFYHYARFRQTRPGGAAES